MKDLTKKTIEKLNDLNERPKEYTDHYEINRKEWYRVTDKEPEVKTTLPYKFAGLVLLAIIALGYIVKQMAE